MMKAALRVFHNETIKMARLKMAYLGPLCIAAVAAIMAMNLCRLFPESSRNGWSLLAQTAQMNVTGVAPFFLLIYAASLVAGETDRGTIRFVLSRPVGRGSFLLGKVLAAWLYLGVLLAATAASGLLCGALLGRLGAVISFDEVIWTPWQAAWRIALSFVLAAVPLAAVAAYGLAISVFARTLLGAICFAIGSWVTLTLIQGFFSDIWYLGEWLDAADLIFTQSLDIPLRVAQAVAGGADGPWDQPGLVTALAVSAAWIVGLLACSLAAFRRQDLNRQ
jgi:ABC-type transport system involved in multi-copper enzyme maturation permease subunit